MWLSNMYSLSKFQCGLSTIPAFIGTRKLNNRSSSYNLLLCLKVIYLCTVNAIVDATKDSLSVCKMFLKVKLLHHMFTFCFSHSTGKVRNLFNLYLGSNVPL